MRILICVLFSYLIGCLNPAALISKLKKKNLRKQGTGNLGATNAMLVFGKGYGAFVMLFDIAKAYIAVKLALTFFDSVVSVGVIAGFAAVVGHIYPFYLNFKGGKGLAAFGGMILGLNPLIFIILLLIALMLMFIINYSVAMPMSAAVLFPILYSIHNDDAVSITVAALTSILIICTHFGNIGKAMRGEDPKIREYVKKHLLGKTSSE